MGRDLAIDLGTANTLVYRQGDGIVFDQPTVVALHGGTGEVLGMGDEVWDLIGGDSGSVVAVRPLRAGTMTEFDITQRMLEFVVKRSHRTRFPKPRVLVAVPSMSSEVEKRAIEEAVRFAGGGRSVTLVEEPLAAAIGAGLPIHEPIGNLIVDIGGGRSEMAVVSMGGVVSGTVDRAGRLRPGRRDPGAHPRALRCRDRRDGGRGDQDRDRIGVPQLAPARPPSSPGASWRAATPSR